MASAAAKKQEAATHHPITKKPYADPPPNVQKMIDEFEEWLDSARVAVFQVKADDKTAGGLIIPDTAKSHNYKSGYVLAAGPEAVLIGNGDTVDGVRQPIEYQICPGDLIHWGKYAGAVNDRHEKGETNVLIMNGQARDGDVLSVISHGRR